MALPEATNPKEGGQNKKTGDQDDKDFDPSAEALIDEIDDERTLEEEEALGGNDGNTVQEELDDLKKESEMPIEELLAYYQKMRQTQGDQNSDDGEEDEEFDDEEDEEGGEDEEEEDDDDETHVNKKAKRGDDDKGDGSGHSKGLQEPPPSGHDESSGQNETKDAKNDESNLDGKPAPSGSASQQDQQQGKSDTAKQAWTSKNSSQSHPTPQEPNSHQRDENRPNDSQQQENTDGSQGVGAHVEIAHEVNQKQRRSITELLLDGEAQMFERLLGYDFDESDDMDEDYSYTDDENDEDEREWRRVIHVGPEYQAEVPDGLHEYSDLPPYETEDTLVWKCNQELSEEQIVEYLRKGTLLSRRTDMSIPESTPKEEFFLYEEQLLYLLLQCNHNMDEALRRRKLDPLKYFLHEPMTVWSQEECLNFEHGLRIYGKDFRAIKENKVPTRTRAEVVAFYYLWKKSERHDVYINQYKLDRKRCSSHPGTTDYMDKFIEDNESNLNVTSSSSPSTPSLGPADGMVGGVGSKLDIVNESGATAAAMYHSNRFGLLTPAHGLENNFATECPDD